MWISLACSVFSLETTLQTSTRSSSVASAGSKCVVGAARAPLPPVSICRTSSSSAGSDGKVRMAGRASERTLWPVELSARRPCVSSVIGEAS